MWNSTVLLSSFLFQKRQTVPRARAFWFVKYLRQCQCQRHHYYITTSSFNNCISRYLRSATWSPLILSEDAFIYWRHIFAVVSWIGEFIIIISDTWQLCLSKYFFCRTMNIFSIKLYLMRGSVGFNRDWLLWRFVSNFRWRLLELTSTCLEATANSLEISWEYVTIIYSTNSGWLVYCRSNFMQTGSSLKTDFKKTLLFSYNVNVASFGCFMLVSTSGLCSRFLPAVSSRSISGDRLKYEVGECAL